MQKSNLFKIVSFALMLVSVAPEKVKANETEVNSNLSAEKETLTQTSEDLDFSYSYKASDLFSEQFLAEAPLDLNRFCRDYPYNSLCKNNLPSSKQETENKPSETVKKELPKTSGWAISPEVSTLGFGGSIIKSISPNFNGRIGINGFSFPADFEDTDVKYKGDVNLFNVSGILDYHPWANSGFRVSAGAVFSDNSAKGTSVPKNNDTFTINGNSYTTDQVGKLKLDGSYSSDILPYIGIGWGNAVKKGQHWGFSVNLGMFFSGSVNAIVTPTFGEGVPQSVQNQVLEDIKVEERKLNDDLKLFTVYPVLTLGVSYQF